MKQQLEDTLNKMPVDHLPAEIRKNLPNIKAGLLKVGGMMDDLGRRDEQSGEVVVDEGSLRKLLGEHFPQATVDHTITALHRLPGSKMKKADGKSSAVPWEAVAAATLAAEPKAQSQPLPGLDAFSSFEEIRAALQQRIPGLPDNLFDAETFTRRLKEALPGTGPQMEALAGSSWDCIVRHFGFWGSIALMVAIAAAATAFGIALVASGGVIGVVFWAAFWPIFWTAVGGAVGLAIILTIVGCLSNPSWN